MPAPRDARGFYRALLCLALCSISGLFIIDFLLLLVQFGIGNPSETPNRRVLPQFARFSSGIGTSLEEVSSKPLAGLFFLHFQLDQNTQFCRYDCFYKD